MRKKALRTALLLAVGLLMARPAAALTIGFYKITNNGNTNVAAQLTADVTDAGGGQVNFTFYNIGPIASSITDIYFDDGTLLDIATVINGPGVSFSEGAAPPNLPGGQSISPNFNTTQGFLADSDMPIAVNGVNATLTPPGEYVTIRFNLLPGQTYADTLAAIALGGADGGLRIGLHVQAIGSTGGSDSYVNTTSVPDGGLTISLLGMALAGLGLAARRRQ